jgi:hypothetical protein
MAHGFGAPRAHRLYAYAASFARAEYLERVTRLVVGALDGASDQAADAGELDGAEHQFAGPHMCA